MNQKFAFTMDHGMENILQETVTVPEGVQRLYIKAVYPQVIQYNCYLLVFDEKQRVRLQKLLGYGRQNICIGEDTWHTTIGGVPGSIGAGQWRVVVGVFTEYMERIQEGLPAELFLMVSDEPQDDGEEAITEPIGSNGWIQDAETFAIDDTLYRWKKKYQKEERWYKGDFHTHTRLSDGKETVENAMRKAKDMRLDFYVPTEHNLLHTGWCDSEIMIVPSVELTTRLGHMNFFGLTKMPDQIFRIMQHMEEEVLDALVLQQIREAKADGWVTSINHPFLTIWKWELDKLPLEDVDCLEIINDPTYPDARDSNNRAIAFLDRLWMDGHRVVGVGGSDSHNLQEERYEGAALPSIPGDPATYVYSNGLSPKRLLKNLKAGHVIVTRYCTVTIALTDGKRDYLPGDEILGKCLRARIKVRNLDKKPEVYMVSYWDAGVLQRERLKVVKQKDGKYTAETEVGMTGDMWRWVRFEVRDKKGEFLAYINPVYANAKKSRYKTYGEVLRAMDGYAD